MKIPPRDIAAQINRVAGSGVLPPAKAGECATCRRCACQCEELRVDGVRVSETVPDAIARVGGPDFDFDRVDDAPIVEEG